MNKYFNKLRLRINGKKKRTKKSKKQQKENPARSTKRSLK